MGSGQLGHRAADGRLQYDLLLNACATGSVLEGYVPIHLFYNELTVPFDTTHGWGCESVFPGDRSEFWENVWRAPRTSR